MKVNIFCYVELCFILFDIVGIMLECFSGNYIELFFGCNLLKFIGKFCGKLLMFVVYLFDYCF